MGSEDKPYRVYRGGRTKGKVPLPQKRTREREQRAAAQGDGAPRFPGPGPARRERATSWARRIGIALLVLFLLLLVWAVASFFSLRSGVKAANKRLPESAKVELAHQDSLILSTPTDILVLGTDHAEITARQGYNRSDSIMVIRTDPGRHRVTFLSIPRDLRVPIPGYGDAKVNAAMQYGGAALAIKTIEAYTGLPINHVIVADFNEFSDVIDALGGITINVPERIVSKFDCPYDSARCAHWAGHRFGKGPQHMNGRRALLYSRVRKNSLNPADTDITRAERQQQVLQAILHKMTSVGTLVKLPFVGGKLVRPLATDLTTAQFSEMAWVYKRAHALHCRLGGTAATLPDGESVIVAEGDDKSRVILTMLGKTAPQPPRPGEGPYGAGCVSGSFSR
jgi:LCP family protein required for cell wall assembly